ncbi:MAG: HAD-IB family hydrolase [Candidatus Micrarchaeia archaeon]
MNAPNKKIIAFFDFCNTLVGMHTANRFVSLCLRYNISFRTLANELLRIIGRRFGILYGERHKMWQIKQLKGLSFEKIKEISKDYVEKELLPKVNNVVFQRMLWHKEFGHDIAIVSGGFKVYLEEFAKMFGVTYVIATDLEFVDHKATGRIRGVDCMGINKVRKIKETINLDEYDLDNSYAYSDSASDIPLLTLVGKGVVVDFGQNIDWARHMNFEIIKVNQNGQMP